METYWVRDGGDAAGRAGQFGVFLRVFGPWQLGLGPEDRTMYTAAGDELDAGRGRELEVAGAAVPGGSGRAASADRAGRP